MRVTDRSRIEAYFHCPTLRALRYHYNPSTTRYDGLGIVPDTESNDLAFGLQTHAALAQGMASAGFEEMLAEFDREAYVGLTPEEQPIADELWPLFYGFCYTFIHHFRPHLLEFYRPIVVEQELTFPLGQTTVMARLDGAVRRLSDDMLFVLEWKTSSYIDKLSFQYEFALQTMIEVAALARCLDEHVGGMLLIGLDKGRYKAVTDKEYEAGMRGKRRLSPFTYFHQRDDGFKVDRTPYWKPGWERLLVTDPAEHMALLEREFPEVFDGVFTTPHPLYAAPWTVARALAEIEILEDRIAQGEQPLHNWNNCHNHQGIMNSECPYIQICHHNEWDGYVSRTPHHVLETTLLGEPR